MDKMMMDKTMIDKLFDLDTSAEERDILCEVTFGKSFMESIREIRYEDFLSGVSKGEYMLNTFIAGPNTENGWSLEIKFACERWDNGLARDFLYEHQDDKSYLGLGRTGFRSLGLAGWLPFGPRYYRMYLGSEEIDSRLLDAIKASMCRYGYDAEMARSLLGFLNKYNIGDGKKKED